MQDRDWNALASGIGTMGEEGVTGAGESGMQPVWDSIDSFGQPLECLQVSRRGSALRVTLTRPDKLNALNPQMRDELLRVLDIVKRRADIGCVVLAARGRAFSAGVDVDTPYFFNGVDDPSIYAGTRLLTEQHELISTLHDLPQVTIAAIQGDAVGGFGFGLAMACDLRVAVQTARFWMIPSRLDVIQDFGLTWLLQRHIGASRTLEVALGGRPITADTAHSWGMVNRVVAGQNELDREVDDLIVTMTETGVDSVRMLKVIVRTGGQSELRDQLAVEAIANGLTFQSDSFRTKHAAYLSALGDRRREER